MKILSLIFSIPVITLSTTSLATQKVKIIIYPASNGVVSAPKYDPAMRRPASIRLARNTGVPVNFAVLLNLAVAR